MDNNILQSMNNRSQSNRIDCVLKDDELNRLLESHVLLIGSLGDALTIETSKNIILSSLNLLSIYSNNQDNNQVNDECTDIDIFNLKSKKERLNKLIELGKENKVKVQEINHIDWNDGGSVYNCVIIVNQEYGYQVVVDQECRERGIPCVGVDCRGVLGRVFSDVGTHFTRYKETPIRYTPHYVSSIISMPGQTIFNYHHSGRGALGIGSIVQFHHMTGLEHLNGTISTVESIGGDSITIDIDTTNYNYNIFKFGYFIELPIPHLINHKSLDQLNNDSIVNNQDKQDKRKQLILYHLFRSFDKFKELNNRYPSHWNQKDSNQILDIIKLDLIINNNNNNNNNDEDTIQLKIEEIEMIKKITFTNQYQMGVVQSIMGGLASFEVLKCITHVYTPINQILMVEESSIVQNQFDDTIPIVIHPRFIDLVSVIGYKRFLKFIDMNILVSGLSGNGCELLKNLVMMGMGSGNGTLHLVDKSNVKRLTISKCYLLNSTDYQKPLSLTLIDKFNQLIFNNNNINNNLNNFKGHQVMLGGQSMDVISKDIVTSLDVMVNTLTSHSFFEYTSKVARAYHLPILECGASDIGCHVASLTPGISPTHFATSQKLDNAPHGSCHHFYYMGGTTLLSQSLQIYNVLFSRYECDINLLKTTLPEAFGIDITLTVSECIEWALKQFHDRFYKIIVRVCNDLPMQGKNNYGNLFWECPKRYPTPIVFDVNNKLHVSFVYHASNIKARSFKIDMDVIDRDLSFTKVHSYLVSCPRANQEFSNVDTTFLFTRWEQTQHPNQQPPCLPAIVSFPHDMDHGNHKVDLVHCIKLLFDQTHQLPLEYDQLDIRTYVYDHQPSFISFNCLAGAWTSLELLKMDEYLSLTNRYYNTSSIVQYTPPKDDPKDCYTTAGGLQFNTWEKLVINHPMTLRQLFHYIYKVMGHEVLMVSVGTTLIYATFLPKEANILSRLDMEIMKIVRIKQPGPFPIWTDYVDIDFVVEDETQVDGGNINCPTISYRFRY